MSTSYSVTEPHSQTVEGQTIEKVGDDAVFVLDVPVAAVPHVSKQFQSIDEVYDFYNEYARQAGFSVRVGNCNGTYWGNMPVKCLYVIRKAKETCCNRTCSNSRAHQ